MGIPCVHTCVYHVYFSHIRKIYTIVYPIRSIVQGISSCATNTKHTRQMDLHTNLGEVSLLVLVTCERYVVCECVCVCV